MCNLRFSASLEMLPQMLDLINQHLEKMGCTHKEHHQIEVSVEEALVNIINYAYPEKSGEVELSCRSILPNQIEITIRDWGVPFNPETLVQNIPIEAPLEERKIGGLGVYFMYQLMDSVTYKREDGANLLKMVKQVSARLLQG